MSKLYYGNQLINKWYEEEDQIMKAYYGDTLMFGDEGEEPTPPTPTIPNYLQFTAVNGEARIGMSGAGTKNVSYSFNGVDWTTWDYLDITIPRGSTVYMKGDNPNGFNTSKLFYKKFTMMGTVEADGNIMSLIYDDNFEGQLTIPNNYCFYNLFSGCTSLTSAPQLPATTLTNYCYNGMFNGCTSLTTAPELPAIALKSNCYTLMFQGCTNLNYIKAMFTTTPSATYTSGWVDGVAASGTFVKNSAATWNVSGVDAIPTGWTIQKASS